MPVMSLSSEAKYRTVESPDGTITAQSLFTPTVAPTSSIGTAPTPDATSPAKIFVVSNSAELAQALSQAAGGGVIALKPGTYSPFSLRNFETTGEVVFTSYDPDNPAVLTGVNVRGTSNITFTKLVLKQSDAATSSAFNIQDSHSIKVDQVVVSGADGPSGYQDSPMSIRNSQNVSITNSEFKHAAYALSHIDSNNVLISGNYFHDIRTDGVRGGGTSNIEISNNFFTNFNPPEGAHPDAIQFWTTNTTTSASNIKISGNVFERGDGGIVQGIFMRDEVGGLPYKNVLISDNVISGGMYNGISVSNAENLLVTNNIVAAYPDQKSWIRVQAHAELEGNQSKIYIIGGKEVPAPEGNIWLGELAAGGDWAIKTWAEDRDLSGYHDAMQDLVDDLPDVVSEPSTIAAAPVVDPVAVQAPTGGAPSSEPILLDLIKGTDGKDTLRGSKAGNSRIEAGDGNDNISGGGTGITEMAGGAGNDAYTVTSAKHFVFENADEGLDVVATSIDYTLTANVEELRLSVANLTGRGNELDNRITGSAGTDTIYGEAGNDSLIGLAGNDTIHGGEGNDAINGGDGDDYLSGNNGDDTLTGANGNDILLGGAGNDTLSGALGDDVLTGGSGADSFNYRNDDFRGNDVITDFKASEGDKINLALIDANSKTAANDKFAFIGSAKFAGKAGELRASVTADGVLLQGDVNGDKIADFSILLKGLGAISVDDILL
ncbi:right-handed parallel beta-helix repeat-containing protein [Sphingomonas sp. FW199]|uniref:right-handed parallel beta-helix repeat-containing protein n=1 Tax=Sphingomonas sp. FW199 TaxID=3400217 RepID=UPI003CE8A319